MRQRRRMKDVSTTSVRPLRKVRCLHGEEEGIGFRCQGYAVTAESQPARKGAEAVHEERAVWSV